MGRITKSSESNIQVISFPGAKFYNLRGFLEKGINNATYPCVEELVLSIGINERENDIEKTSKGQLNRLIKRIRHTFPKAEIFMADMQWVPSTQSKRVNIALNSLSAVFKSLEHVEVLSPLPSDQFVIDPQDRKYKIHWSKETANAMLEHWLNCLNC